MCSTTELSMLSESLAAQRRPGGRMKGRGRTWQAIQCIWNDFKIPASRRCRQGITFPRSKTRGPDSERKCGESARSDGYRRFDRFLHSGEKGGFVVPRELSVSQRENAVILHHALHAAVPLLRLRRGRGRDRLRPR